MAPLIHPDDLIHRLERDRRRCFVVAGRPGQGKTSLARAMAERYDSQYLDILSTFRTDPVLSASVDTVTPRRFTTEFLQSYATGPLVLVDEMEFLWHAWDASEKHEFLSIIKRWGKPAFFGVFLPPDPAIEAFVMADQDGLPRKLSLQELQALG